ncbi:VOC family protein [Shimazuella sp. AN120528]|uniref:VOC family protein n=1 Tax=Shimazuella soli TaxID=1892854 RepID=UPI001F0F783C|nr:VOC family protein [Shimazuella soli]MCH5585531.1 VOC family protein [Shimazuella soli]
MALRMNPYITLDGNTKEAVEFYQEAIGAKVISIQTFGEMPEDPSFSLPPEAKDRVLHALLKVGETDLMFSDTFPGQQQQTGSRVSIAIVVNSVEESRAIFEKLSQEGKVYMPLQKTFWSESYGMVIDKYDVQWQITTE